MRRRDFLPLVSMLMVALSPAPAAPEAVQITVEPGKEVEVLIELSPADASGKGASRLCLVLGGGPGEMRQAQREMDCLGVPLAKRGFTAVAPISAKGRSFYKDRDAELLVKLVHVLQERPGISKDKALLAGRSNGGMSAFVIAGKEPSLFCGILALPGIAMFEKTPGTLHGLPVFLRIGGEDQLGWAEEFDKTVEALTRLGATLDAKVISGAPHGFDIDWDEIDAWLKAVL